MTEFRPSTPDDAVAVASAALSHAVSAPVAIDAVQNLGNDNRRNLVLRAQAVQAGKAPRSIIIKALHAATIGCRDDNAAILREGFPAASIPPPAHRWIENVARVPHARLGGEFPEDEAQLILDHLRQPAPWQALVHGDPCPDNVLLAADGRAVLIDFEFARPGHALLDAAYWRMGFPTCWCAGTVPADVRARIDQAYRAAIADAVPVATDDDAFGRESALIDAAWLLGNLAWLLDGALAEDGKWGRATNRRRIITYLDRAIRSAREADILPRLRALAAAWRDDLHRRWPDTAPLSDFPAFAAGPTAARAPAT